MTPDFIDPLSTMSVELDLAQKRQAIKKDATGTTAILEQFETTEAQTLCLKVGHLLRTTYKQYAWVVRSFGGRKEMGANGNWTVQPLSVGFTCSHLTAHGGSKALMYINPKDNDTELEFEAKVKKMAGELLERARLTRTRGIKDVGQVEKLPDGFEDIVPQKRIKYTTPTSFEHFMQLTEQNIKKAKAIEESNKIILPE